jgi:hypothetical protein
MKKLVFAFLAGAVISTVILLPLTISERRRSWQYGRKAGIIQGQFDAADALQKEFGVWDGKGPHRVLLSVKTTSVVSVETNGVQTVRVIP